MKKIQINQLIEIGDNYYYLLALYFTKRRIMCEFIAEGERFYSPDLRNAQGELIQEWRSSRRKIEEYDLYINDSIYQWQGGFIHYISRNDKKNILKDLEIPKCIQDKELVLVEEEFEPFDLSKEIMQIKFSKEVKERIILIQKEINLPIGKFNIPYEVNYEDTLGRKMRKINFHQLNTIDISHFPHLKKRVALSNQIPLIAQIEVEDDIDKANIFIKKSSQEDDIWDINLNQIETKIKKQNMREGFQYRNHFLGMINTNTVIVPIIVFSVDIKRKVEKKVIIYDHWNRPYVK